MTFVKICGLTSFEDAALAHDVGADALGFILVPGSKREVDIDTVARIVSELPSNALTVAVVRDRSVADLADVVRRTKVQGVQLNGNEDNAYIEALRAQVSVTVLRVVTAGGPASIGAADYLMVDAPHPGSGMVFDWSLVGNVPGPFLLAGGLTPDNVVQAITTAGAWGVDVATGVEQRPGVKDADKVRAFITAARSL